MLVDGAKSPISGYHNIHRAVSRAYMTRGVTKWRSVERGRPSSFYV